MSTSRDKIEDKKARKNKKNNSQTEVVRKHNRGLSLNQIGRSLSSVFITLTPRQISARTSPAQSKTTSPLPKSPLSSPATSDDQLKENKASSYRDNLKRMRQAPVPHVFNNYFCSTVPEVVFDYFDHLFDEENEDTILSLNLPPSDHFTIKRLSVGAVPVFQLNLSNNESLILKIYQDFAREDLKQFDEIRKKLGQSSQFLGKLYKEKNHANCTGAIFRAELCEFITGSNLSKLILDETVIHSTRLSHTLNYGEKILNLVHTYYQLGILFPDIKPENFVVDQDDNLKTPDYKSMFALSEQILTWDAIKDRTTPEYLPPAIMDFSTNPPSAKTEKISSGMNALSLLRYAIGLTLYQLATGIPVTEIVSTMIKDDKLELDFANPPVFWNYNNYKHIHQLRKLIISLTNTEETPRDLAQDIIRINKVKSHSDTELFKHSSSSSSSSSSRYFKNLKRSESPERSQSSPSLTHSHDSSYSNDKTFKLRTSNFKEEEQSSEQDTYSYSGSPSSSSPSLSYKNSSNDGK